MKPAMMTTVRTVPMRKDLSKSLARISRLATIAQAALGAEGAVGAGGGVADLENVWSRV